MTPEVPFGESRIDFLLEKGGDKGPRRGEERHPRLRDSGVACFPDAPTDAAANTCGSCWPPGKRGYRAVIFFLVQRGEATAFTPADAIDPDYGRLLREVAATGVEVLAYRSVVTPEENRVGERIPVLL